MDTEVILWVSSIREETAKNNLEEQEIVLIKQVVPFWREELMFCAPVKFVKNPLSAQNTQNLGKIYLLVTMRYHQTYLLDSCIALLTGSLTRHQLTYR